MQNYSVLMSVYAKENPEFLKESVESMLKQTFPTNDFVIVCDGQLTVELDQILSKFVERNLQLFQIVRLEENQGLGKALNNGMKYCKNSLIARMDSDDISLPDKCERQINKFTQDPKLDIVSGTVKEFSEDLTNITATKRLPETHDEICKYAKRRSPFNHPAVMYKKDAVLRAGSYQDFPLFEDYYLWVRMIGNKAKTYNVQELLVLMRAGKSMYSRRGGLDYFKKVRTFRKFMWNSGFSSFVDYGVTIVAQLVVCIVPNNLRMWVYKTFLRG